MISDLLSWWPIILTVLMFLVPFSVICLLFYIIGNIFGFWKHTITTVAGVPQSAIDAWQRDRMAGRISRTYLEALALKNPQAYRAVMSTKVRATNSTLSSVLWFIWGLVLLGLIAVGFFTEGLGWGLALGWVMIKLFASFKKARKGEEPPSLDMWLKQASIADAMAISGNKIIEINPSNGRRGHTRGKKQR